MATEKRLIEIIECLRNCANNTGCERCSRWLYPCDEKCVDDLMASAAEELEKFVNVVEVVHGRWIEKIDVVASYLAECEELFYECSVCNSPNFGESPYCPNCGAKMDGDGNG